MMAVPTPASAQSASAARLNSLGTAMMAASIFLPIDLTEENTLSP